MHEKIVNPFNRIIYNTKWATERGYQFQVSFPFLKTHRLLMMGRQARWRNGISSCSKKKKQIICVLALILECKFSVIPTPKQQHPLSHLEIMGAIILQEQQTMVAGKRRWSEEALSVLQRTLHLPYLRDIPCEWEVHPQSHSQEIKGTDKFSNFSCLFLKYLISYTLLWFLMILSLA